MNRSLVRILVFCLVTFTSCSAIAQDKVLLCTGKSSHSYHKDHCTGLKQCRATVVTVNKKDAIKAGKDACDFCYGHNADNTQIKSLKGNTSAQNSKSISSQCSAITKKGSQCSRTASSNGYCWQHGK